MRRAVEHVTRCITPAFCREQNASDLPTGHTYGREMGTVIPLQGRAPEKAPETTATRRESTARPSTAEHVGPVEPLWRDLVGARLRQERQRQGRRLVDVAERAGVSTQYLSEIERGRKEPSSEIVAAVGLALGLSLLDLTAGVARTLHESRLRSTHSRTGHPTGPVCLAA